MSAHIPIGSSSKVHGAHLSNINSLIFIGIQSFFEY